LLSAYLDGELPPEAARAVAAWLDGDPEALRESERLRRLWDLLGTYPDEPVPVGFSDRVLAAAGVGRSARPTSRLFFARRPALAAASLLVALGAGLLVGRLGGRPTGGGEPPASGVVALLGDLPEDQLQAVLEQADVLLTVDEEALDADYDGIERGVLGG